MAFGASCAQARPGARAAVAATRPPLPRRDNTRRRDWVHATDGAGRVTRWRIMVYALLSRSGRAGCGTSRLGPRVSAVWRWWGGDWAAPEGTACPLLLSRAAKVLAPSLLAIRPPTPLAQNPGRGAQAA